MTIVSSGEVSPHRNNNKRSSNSINPVPHLFGLAINEKRIRQRSGSFNKSLSGLEQLNRGVIRNDTTAIAAQLLNENAQHTPTLYGTNSQALPSSPYETMQKPLPNIKRNFVVASSPNRKWNGMTEITFNVLGTGGFVIGSLLWCINEAFFGTIIFAISCICCGISCTIYSIKFYTAIDYMGFYALVQQACGCFIFAGSSFAFLYPQHITGALIGFYTASLLFLTGCLLTQIQCKSFTGVLAPFLPGHRHGLIPTSLANSIGSGLFTVGSIGLFYNNDYGQIIGSWCYEIGSIFFFFASWGDFTVWWNMGVTQLEHQNVASLSSLEAEYAAVKFL